MWPKRRYTINKTDMTHSNRASITSRPEDPRLTASCRAVLPLLIKQTGLHDYNFPNEKASDTRPSHKLYVYQFAFTIPVEV